MGKTLLHRVVVTLTDGTRRVASVDDKLFDNDVKILDNRTLLLRIGQINNNSKKNTSSSKSKVEYAFPIVPRYYRHLQFNAVGYEHETHIRNEVSELIEHMLRHKKNSCLVRFTPVRTQNLNLLTRILVAEVDKIMLSLRCRLKNINVEYYDVRKFDMVNMLIEATTSPHLRQNIQARNKLDEFTCHTVQSTRDLFQWLISEYSLLRGRGVGDDYIDVEFVFVDCLNKKHHVRLALFQIYASGSRDDLLNFFRSLQTGKPHKGSLLADCLKESFDLKQPMHTLLMFEVPLGRDCPMWMRKMLRLADEAYSSIEMAYQRSNNEDVEDPSSAKTLKANAPKLLASKGALKTQTKLVAIEQKPQIAQPPQHYSSIGVRRRATNLSKDDYNSLAYWYNRIDLNINDVQIAMEKFYSALYQNKVMQICNQLKYIDEEEGDCGGDSEIVNLKSVNEVEAQDKYHKALANFKRLDGDVEKSSFASTLKVYLSTKSFELTEAEKALKQREIQNLRQNLVNYIKMELPVESKEHEELND